MFFNRAEDEVVKRVEDRVAAWTMLPSGNAEGMQVLQYVVSCEGLWRYKGALLLAAGHI